MNENNDYRPENEGFSNPDNLYHYNYRSQEDQGRHEAPAVSKKPSFWQKTGVKVTALLLACAVVGGAAGYGGAQSAQNRQHDKPGQSFLHFRDVFLPILFSRRHTISFSTCRTAALLSADMVF